MSSATGIRARYSISNPETATDGAKNSPHWALGAGEPISLMKPQDAELLRWCPFNRKTRRFHVPMVHLGQPYFREYCKIRESEVKLTKILNYLTKENRAGFYDTAWETNAPDYWFICDDYIEYPIIWSDYNHKWVFPEYDHAKSFERNHVSGDTRVVITMPSKVEKCSFEYKLVNYSEKEGYLEWLAKEFPRIAAINIKKVPS